MTALLPGDKLEDGKNDGEGIAAEIGDNLAGANPDVFEDANPVDEIFTGRINVHALLKAFKGTTSLF